MLYYEWVNIYKREYEQVFERKDENWRKNHDCKNLKDLSYQAEKKEKYETDEKDEEDEEDEETISEWLKVEKDLVQ